MSGSRLRPSIAIGTLALLGLSVGLGVHHHQPDEGLSADEIDEATIADALAVGQSGDALLLDLVEPEDGEGGSEAELLDLVSELGLPAEPAGFYSETEHLWRVHGTPEQLDALRERLEDHDLVEGMEAELVYALPDHAFSAMPGDTVADFSPQRPERPRVEPNDPMFPQQWHMEAIHAPEAWTETKGEGAVVAVIDTGVAWKDLSWNGVDAKKVPDLEGIEFVHAETFLDRALPEGLDDHAHGTHVAGTIAQATDNGIGVAGVAHEAKIMPLKVLAGDGRGSVASISNAIRWAADHDADVINMSLGGPLPSRVMAKAVEYAHGKGVTVICAAGNEKRSKVSYPAAYEGSVAIAATNSKGERSFYSNWGKKLDLSAPGGDTRGNPNGGVLQNTIAIGNPAKNDYLWFQGTSMASPHAAGVAALVVSAGVSNPTEVERILEKTAVHPNNVDWDQQYGAGILDAEAAVAAAKSDYQPERAGFLGAFGLLALAGPAAFFRRRRAAQLLGLAGGATLAAGAVLSPLAYGAAGLFGGLGSGLWLSALLPAALTVALVHRKSLRGLLAGLNLGTAALLAHGAVVLPTLMEGVAGGPTVDRLFLAANAVVCALLARRVLKLGRDD